MGWPLSIGSTDVPYKTCNAFADFLVELNSNRFSGYPRYTTLSTAVTDRVPQSMKDLELTLIVCQSPPKQCLWMDTPS